MANSPSKYSIFASLQEDKISTLLMLLVPAFCTLHQNCCANLKTVEPRLVGVNILSKCDTVAPASVSKQVRLTPPIAPSSLDKRSKSRSFWINGVRLEMSAISSSVSQ